jgi:hypothetical protein
MEKAARIIALTGLVIFASATAEAQGWYDYAMAGGADAAAVASAPEATSYRELFTGPGGELYSGTVHSFSANLGSGVSLGLFTSFSDGPAGEISGLPGSSLIPGFAGSVTTNYANGLSLNTAVAPASNISGRMSVSLGSGLSLDFLGGLSRGPANGFYFGPGYGFDSRTSANMGAGFSMNLGHGGTLSGIGGVSNFGCARPCSPVAGWR